MNWMNIILSLSIFLIFSTKIESKIYPLKLYDKKRHLVSKYTLGKLRNLNTDDSNILTDLFGDSDYLNYYYVEVLLGKNMEKSTLIVDTGSSLMCLTCASTCKSCGKHENPDFQSNLSESFRILSCDDSQCSPFKGYKSCNKNMCSFSIVRNILFSLMEKVPVIVVL